MAQYVVSMLHCLVSDELEMIGIISIRIATGYLMNVISTLK
jgi:hypothetical protein